MPVSRDSTDLSSRAEKSWILRPMNSNISAFSNFGFFEKSVSSLWCRLTQTVFIIFYVVVYSDPVVFPYSLACLALQWILVYRHFRRLLDHSTVLSRLRRADLSVRCGCEGCYHSSQSAGSWHHSGDGLLLRHSNDLFDGFHVDDFPKRHIKWINELTGYMTGCRSVSGIVQSGISIGDVNSDAGDGMVDCAHLKYCCCSFVALQRVLVFRQIFLD